MKSIKTNSHCFTDIEGSAAECINPHGKAPIILICEHASNFIPESLANLGLSSAEILTHVAWDIGAYEMACRISQLLDAPLIASRVSRLVYDCNRAPESGIGIPRKSELIEIYGNKDLTTEAINSRIKYVYEPFHQLVNQTINERVNISKQHVSPAIITLHSFTPVYFGSKRSVELGILHDKDDRLAKAMMKSAVKNTDLLTEFNAPYDVSDNVMHTINQHALEQGFLNVMIEVKNDLLSNSDEIQSVASDLSSIIQDALASIE